MKVLLADDNPLILEHFVKMVDWKEYGFDTVLTAMDGKKALLEFEKHRPELVITDIQMPRLTGIELAEQIKKESPDTIFYFLTSYEEFSYVKSALELGSHGYLLKHETKKEKLGEILEEVKREIKKRKLHTRYTAEAALHELIRDLEGKNGMAAVEEYELSLPDRYDLFLLEDDHIYPAISEAFAVEERKPEGKAVMAFCYRLIPELTAVIQTGKWSYLCLAKAKEAVMETVYELKRELLRQYQDTFSILILAEQASIGECAERYMRTQDARRQKIFSPRSSVTHAGYIGRSRQISQALELKKADEWLKERESEKLCGWVDRNYMQTIEARDSARFEQLTRYLTSLLLEYHNRIVNVQKGAAFQAFDRTDQESWYDAGSIYQWMRRKMVELVRILEEPSGCAYSDVVNRAMEYVHRNYINSDLSVEMIAEKLKISANYLNTVFKKETGETLWKLVIKVRMERARELLNLGNDRMTDICKKTGYSSMSYFSKVFRETYGMSPMEYRRKNNNEN